MQHPQVKAFFDENTNTFSYVVTDPETRVCAVIDSVLDYDAASATTSTHSADQIIDFVKTHQLKVEWILETHVHADHLTASQYLKEHLGGKIAMSEKISIVQETFSSIYNLDVKMFNSHQTFDYLFKDDEHFKIGHLDAYNIPTPGHTPACLSYVIGDSVFVGDTLFMPTGWWHWMKYLDGSFSISLRAWDKSWAVKAHSLWNLAVQRNFDNFMKGRYKKRYMDWKERKAVEIANNALKRGLPK